MAELLPFGDISEMHQQLSEKSPFFAQLTPEQFAQLGNEWTQGESFSRGLNDNVVKQASRAIDTLLQPGAEMGGEITAALGRATMPQFEQEFRAVGESLPRDLATMSLLGFGPLGVAGAAAMAGGKAYEETDSKTAGLIGAGSMALLPATARIGGEVAANVMGKATYGAEEVAGKIVPHAVAPQYPLAGFIERTVEAAGRNVGVMINQEVATQLTSKTVTGDWYPITPQHIAELAGPQLAFGIVDLIGAMPRPPGAARSLTAAKADQARSAKIVSNLNEQSRPPQVTVEKAQSTAKNIEQIELPLQEAVAEVANQKAAAKRMETVRAVTDYSTITAEQRAKLDKGYVELLLLQGTVEEQADGSLVTKKRMPLRGDELVRESLAAAGAGVGKPTTVVKSSEIQNPRTEEGYRDLYKELPADESERQKMLPSETPRGEARGVKEQLALPGMASGGGADPAAKQFGGAPEPAQQKPLITGPKGEPVAPLGRQTSLRGQQDIVMEDQALAPILEQLKPLVDAEILRDLQMPIEANVPLDIKIARILEVQQVLKKGLLEALVRRGVSGEMIGRHPGLSKFFESYDDAKHYIGRKFGQAPTVELLDQAYKAVMADVAETTLALRSLIESQVNVSKKPATLSTDVAQKLRDLEQQPHGAVVLKALTEVLATNVQYRGATALDTGMITDRAYYRLLEKATKLNDPAEYSKAVLGADDPKQALVRYLRMIPKGELDVGLQELQQLRYLEELAIEAKVPLVDMDLESLGDWLAADPMQAAKIERARMWLTKFDRPLTLDEWNAAGSKEIVARGETFEPVATPAEALTKQYTAGRWGTKTGRKELEDRFNKTMEMMRDGTLPFSHDNRGFRIKDVPDSQKPAILKAVGLEVTNVDSGWRNFRSRTVNEVVKRLNMMFEREMIASVKENTTGADGDVPMQNTIHGSAVAAHTLVKGADPGREALAAGAKQWFREHFNRRGMNPEFVEMYSDVLSKVALAFSETSYTTLATMHDVRRSGVQMTTLNPLDGIARTIIGLDAKSVGFKDARVEAAYAMHTLSHELFHRQLADKPPPWLSEMLEMAQNMTPAERGFMLLQMQKVVVPTNVRTAEPTFDRQLRFRTEVAGKDAEEFLADMAGFFTAGYLRPDRVTTVSEMNKMLVFSDSHTQQFLSGFYMSLVDNAQALSSFFKGNAPQLAPAFESIVSTLHAIMKPLRMVDEAVGALRQLELSEPANYAELVAKGYVAQPFNVSEVQKMLGMRTSWSASEVAPGLLKRTAELMGLSQSKSEEAAFGIKVGAIKKTFMESHQLAQMFPQLRGPFDIVRSYRPLLNTFTEKILQPMMRTTSLLKQQVLDVKGTGMKAVLSNDKAREAFSRIVLQEQLQGKSMTAAEQRAEMAGLSPETQQHVIDFRENVRSVMVQLRTTMIDQLWQSEQFVAAQTLMANDKSLRASDARALGSQLTQLAWKAVHGDTAAGAQLDAMASTTGLIKAKDVTIQTLAKIAEFEKRTEGNDYFMSEMRLGRYYAGYVNPAGKNERTKAGLMAFETKEEALKWGEKESAKTGVPMEKFHFWDKTIKGEEYKSLSPDIMQLFLQREQPALMHELMKLDLPENIARDIMAYVPGEATMRDIEMGGTERFLMERKLRAGREELDMAGNFLPHVRGVANALAKKWVRGEMGMALMDPEIRGQAELHQQAIRHYKSVLNPPTPEFSFMKRMVFGYYLGFNPSSMLLNGFDTVTSLTPQLTQDSGSVVQGYKYAAQAMHDLSKLFIDGKFGNPELDGEWKGSGATGFLDRIRKLQGIDFGIVQETYDAETMTALNLNGLANGSTNPFQLGKRALDFYATTGRMLYGSISKLNSHVAFLASYKMAREHGVLENNKLTKLEPEQAFWYAYRTTGSTQHSGGAAARPVGMFSDLGKFHGAVGLAYSLSTYTVGTISMMARLGLQAIHKMPGPERTAATKAFAQMMFTQTAIAGVLGLPGVAFALSALNKFFPNIEATKAVEDGFRALAGDDDDMGGLVSDMAMRGVLNKGFGIDLSSRLALANVMGVSAYDGITVQALMGPAGGMFANMLQAAQQGTTGNIPAAMEKLVPAPFKNMLHLYRNQGVIRDAGGRPLIGDMSEAERAMFVMGFRPASVTAVRDKQRLVEQHENVARLENQNFNRETATLLMAGDIAGVRQRLMLREQETNGLYNAYRGAMDVADEVVDRVAPFDLSRGGSRFASGERRRLASQLGQPTWSETQRLMTKKSLETQMGLPGIVSRTEMSRAQIIDQLMQMNPRLGRAEAMQMANVMLGRQQPQLP